MDQILRLTLDHAPTIYGLNLGRYLLFAGLAFVVFWLWKWNDLRHRHIQPRRPKAAQLGFEVRHSMVTAVIFTVMGMLTFAGSEVGIFRIYRDASERGWGYWVFSVVALILLHDAYFYWTHRAMHHPRIYRWMHRVHHRSATPSPWAAYSFAWPEAIVQAAIVPLAAAIMPVHEGAVFVFLLFMIGMNVIGHLNIELYPRGFARSRWSSWWSTSTHHNMHHHYFECNYGLYFTWWDRLMGTMHPEYEDKYESITRGEATTG